MKTVTTYIADDGTNFETPEACKAHEEKAIWRQLVGRTDEEIQAGISREDVELADAIEALGRKIAVTRLESGERRRRAKGSADGAPAPTETAVSEAQKDSVSEPKSARSTDPADPYEQGRQAFFAGEYGTIPAGMSKSDGDCWLSGWDAESVAAAARQDAKRVA